MDNNQTKLLLAVSPDAPEWMRAVGQTLATNSEGAHGAILTICWDDSQTQLAQNINADDIVSTIANLCDLLREKFGEKMAEALIEFATTSKTEETE